MVKQCGGITRPFTRLRFLISVTYDILRVRSPDVGIPLTPPNCLRLPEVVAEHVSQAKRDLDKSLTQRYANYYFASTIFFTATCNVDSVECVNHWAITDMIDSAQSPPHQQRYGDARKFEQIRKEFETKFEAIRKGGEGEICRFEE